MMLQGYKKKKYRRHFKDRKQRKIALTGVCVALAAGDAPYCTPELYKECADPALGKTEASFMSDLSPPTEQKHIIIIP